MGFAVHILGRKSKSPVSEKWSEAKVYTYSELEDEYYEGVTSGRGNVGVRLGEPSVVDGLYLHAIDLDIRDKKLENEAVSALKRVLRGYKLFKFWTVRSGSGGASRHYYFLTERPFRTTNLARSDEFVTMDGRKRRSWEIDLLGTGKQAVLPPSIHPDTGKPYEWIVEPDDFPVVVDADHIEDLLAEDDYELIDNDEPLGLSKYEAEDMLADLQGMADDHETWRDVGMALKHEFGEDGWKLFDDWSKQGRGYNKRDNRYQWDRFDNNRKRKITMRSISMVAREQEREHIVDEFEDGDTVRAEVAEVERQNKLAAEARQTIAEKKAWQKGDPEMAIIAESVEVAPAFPLDIFPKKVRDHIAKMASAMTTPADYIAAAFITACSIAVGNRRIVRANATWTQPLVFWCQVVGAPSMKKSPGINLFRKSLAEIERMYLGPYLVARQNWEQKKKAIDIGRKQHDAKRMKEDGEMNLDEYPENLQYPAEPKRRDLLIEDITPEAVIRMMANNPWGMGVFSDELSNWLNGLERYSNNTGRSLWLKIYDASSHKMNRVKDGDDAVIAERPFASIIGAIQPDKLLEITALSNADDGLQSRFMPFWPDYVTMPMSKDDVEIEDWYTPIFENMQALETKQDGVPLEMKFTKAARHHLVDWSNDREIAELGYNHRIAGVFGKAGGQVVRMAGMLELIKWAVVSDDFDPKAPPTEVSLESVKAAIRFRQEYLKPMQKRVFQRSVESDEMWNARIIASWIIENEVERLNIQKMRRGIGIRGLNKGRDAEIIEDAINQLISLHWVRVEERDGGKRGRPSKNYVVNERVWELLDKS